MSTDDGTPGSDRASRSARLTSLDGVRGLAAFVVVLWHAFLLAEPHLIERWGPQTRAPGGLHWWLFASPLSLLISGEQAVVVFFLLSGIVLTLPVLRADRFDWWAYYPRRIVRLWLPVVVSVVLAIALLLLVPRASVPVDSWQWRGNAHAVDVAQAAREAGLVSFAPTINGPLWSLSWEMAFSIALPLFVVTALVVRRWWVVAIVAAVVVVDLGVAWDLSPLKYLPVFLIGAIAATNLDAIMAAGDRIGSRRLHRLLWWSLFAVSGLVVTASRISDSVAGPAAALTHVMSALGIVGCMGLVFLAVGSVGARKVLDAKPAQWLGRISFSLYLVHVPLMVTLAYLFGWDRWGMASSSGFRRRSRWRRSSRVSSKHPRTVFLVARADRPPFSITGGREPGEGQMRTLSSDPHQVVMRRPCSPTSSVANVSSTSVPPTRGSARPPM
ncbi:acyltransferase family protein [Microbacterium memoriense]|uniref:Acyltransferase n=1 Tax=Microbacterium memoriense TaxID=2978350 RepID=A0ABT2PDX4_9MICO|nr:acyltransferase [Microbacterium memoriense]MCT9002635.1 acyltransferase [Microbacterium memoriense]